MIPPLKRERVKKSNDFGAPGAVKKCAALGDPAYVCKVFWNHCRLRALTRRFLPISNFFTVPLGKPKLNLVSIFPSSGGMSLVAACKTSSGA
jgi:hypothetical protein